MVGAWRPRWFVNRVEYSAPIQRLLRLTDRRWLGMFVLPERRECQRLVCYCYTNPQCYGTANGTRTRKFNLERVATLPFRPRQQMEMRTGFEPANNRVAVCPLKPNSGTSSFGVYGGTRIHNHLTHNQALYQLSYAHMELPAGIEPAPRP